MPSNPLSYAGIKAVLQYMDPNQRFELSLRSPSLRKTEKIVPLKIDRLAFGDLDNEKALIINDTKYQLGIYQKYNDPLQTPEFVKINNAKGYSHYERDRYGCVDWRAEKRLNRGDIRLSPNLVGEPDELYGDDLDAKIAMLEKDFGIFEMDETLNTWELATYRRDSRDYRRAGVRPPYKFYIQLLTMSKDGTKTERVEYNRPLSDALRHLVTTFFHHRRTHVVVNRLELLSTDMTLRLPVDLKFKIRELTFFNHENTSSALKAITPLLHKKNFPLESLTVVDTRGSGDLLILADAKKLIITKEIREVAQYANLGNREIHIKNAQFSLNELLRVVREWLLTDVPVGTVHSFGVVVESERDLEKFFRPLQFEGLNVIVGKRSFTIMLSEHSKLHISYERDGYFKRFDLKWNMTFEVVSR